jgi:hypothetical protein
MGPAIFIPMAIGAVVNTGVAIAKGKPFGEVLTSGLTGAALGAATGGIGSLVSGGLAGGTAVAGEVGKAALTEGVSQTAQQGIGSALAEGAKAGTGEVVSQAASSALPNVAAEPSLMQTLSNATNVAPQQSSLLASNAPINIASDAYPSLMGTPQKISLLDSATSGVKDLQPINIAPTETSGAVAIYPKNAVTTSEITTSAQPSIAERYAKALEESNKLNKTKMYVEGAKTAVDTAQAATAKEPQPSLRPMGYPQPVQLTGGNTDLMAQLMALAGGR